MSMSLNPYTRYSKKKATIVLDFDCQNIAVYLKLLKSTAENSYQNIQQINLIWIN